MTNMFKKNNPKLILGRWNHTKDLDELNHEIYLANYDHCGPWLFKFKKRIQNIYNDIRRNYEITIIKSNYKLIIIKI